MARMCEAGGIVGYKTNHYCSYTRLFQAGVDEQLMKTGLHSLEGVRSYKRTNKNSRQENISDTLLLTSKKHCPSTDHYFFSVLHLPALAIINMQLMIKPENLQNMFTLHAVMLKCEHPSQLSLSSLIVSKESRFKTTTQPL